MLDLAEIVTHHLKHSSTRQKDLRAGPKIINFAGPLRLGSPLIQLEQEAGVKRKVRRALKQLWREEASWEAVAGAGMEDKEARGAIA